MKLKSKNSFLKRISCIALSLMLCLTSFSLAGFVPTLEVKAATDTSALSNAISAYESKMNDTIYTNMEDAYNKYILACEAYDAITYGERSDIDVNNVASNLSKATDAMTSFSSPVFNETAYFYNSSMTATDGYSNVVYQSSNPYTAFGYQGTDAWQETGRIKLKMAIPYEIVLVNDGVNEVYSPIVVQGTNDGASSLSYSYDKSKKLRYVTLSSDSSTGYTKLELKRNWNMEEVNCTWKSPLNNKNPVPYQYTETDHSISFSGSGDNNHTLTNRLYFSSVTTNGNTSSYYDKFSGNQIKLKIAAHRYSRNYNSKKFEDAVDTNEYYANGTQYVINYKPINTKLSSAQTKLTTALKGKSVSNYKEGGLRSLFELIDKCTADNVDPTKYTYSSGVEKAVTDCAKAIQAVDAISVPDVKEDSNQSSYELLRSEIKTYNSTKSMIDSGEKYYTNDTLTAYEDACNKAKAVMADLITNGYQPTTNTTPSDKAQALKTARENLQEIYKVTFKNSAGKVVEIREIVPGNTLGKLPENTITKQDTDAKKHTVYSWPAGVSENTEIRGSGEYNEISAPGPCVFNKGTPTFEIIKDGETQRTLQKHIKTCTVCGAEYTELHNLEIDSNKNAKCSECDYTVESGYTSNGFRITKGNLFDFDAYAANEKSITSVQDNGVDKAAVSVDTDNDTITVAGNTYDAYTLHGPTSDFYRIKVTPGNTYTLSYIPSTLDNQAFAFFSDGTKYLNANDPEGVKTTWNRADYNATAKEEHKMTFTAPENCEYVDFRFGTVNSGAICTFSNISFYESDKDGNPTNGGYKVLASDVPSGTKVLEKLGIPNADKCNASYAMKDNNKRIGKEDLIYTNLNITLDTEHNYPDSLVISGNTATITCSDCNYSYTLDLTAYKAAVTDANTSINNSAAYKTESRNALSDVLSTQAAALNSAKTQDDVNACTAAIVTANKIKDGDNGGLLEYLTYNVTFIIQNGTSSKTVINNEAHHYGDIVNMNVDEGNVYKWTKTTINSENEPVEIKYADNATSTSYVVHENATIIAYLSPVQEASTNNVKIILKDKTDRISGIAYATNGTITLYDTYIAVGDTKLYSKSVTYYNAKGYTINGVVVSGEYAIPEGVTEIVLRPIYIAGSTFQIDCDAATSINGKNVTSYQAKWDEPITIKASGEVIWYTKSGEKEIILAQGDTYKFRANESIKIYTKDVPQTNVAPSAKIGYFDYDVELNKVTVVNNFFVPSGMTVKSAGVILSTKTNDIETLKKQTNGRFSVTPDKFTENGNQVRISVSRTANNAFTMHALAYVEFQDGTVCYADEIATCQYSPKQA